MTQKRHKISQANSNDLTGCRVRPVDHSSYSKFLVESQPCRRVILDFQPLLRAKASEILFYRVSTPLFIATTKKWPTIYLLVPFVVVPIPLRRQSQHSDIAKAAINTRAATMGPPPPPHPAQAPLAASTTLKNITNLDSHDFEIPKPAYKTFVTPPTPHALGQALQAANMTGVHGFQDGFGHPPSDTPMGNTPQGSAPSTAPSSPRV